MDPVLYNEKEVKEDEDFRQCILQECDSPCPRLTSDGTTAEADERSSSADMLLDPKEEDLGSHQLLHATPNHPSTHHHLIPRPPAHPKGRRKGHGVETEGGEQRGGREKWGREKDEVLEEGIERYKGPPRRHRDLVAYWLLGFCNNFTYWVMITAAYDLLGSQSQTVTERAQQQQSSTTLQNSSGVTIYPPYDATIFQNESVDTFVNTFKCLRHSTGAILVADTLPATALTMAAPLTLLAGVDLRVWLVGGLCVASYLTLGLATSKFVFFGVALASASRGFSDTTFLGHASHYHKHVLSLWSSGTGVATFLGPLLYSSLTTGGMSPRHALLVFLVVPIIIAVSFWCILSRFVKGEAGMETETQETLGYTSVQDTENEQQKRLAVVKEKLFLLIRAKQYLLPLTVFYFIMYFTNQGLLELVYFPASHLTHGQQYSWSNTVRCLGTLISRSAHKLFLLPSTWIYSALAMVILLVIGVEAHYHYLPSQYIIFTLLFLQGLLEGAAFRSTVFNMHEKAGDKEREFCLGIFPISLFLPAMLAGFASIPVHDVLCQNHLYLQ